MTALVFSFVDLKLSLKPFKRGANGIHLQIQEVFSFTTTKKVSSPCFGRLLGYFVLYVCYCSIVPARHSVLLKDIVVWVELHFNLFHHLVHT